MVDYIDDTDNVLPVAAPCSGERTLRISRQAVNLLGFETCVRDRCAARVNRQQAKWFLRAARNRRIANSRNRRLAPALPHQRSPCVLVIEFAALYPNVTM